MINEVVVTARCRQFRFCDYILPNVDCVHTPFVDVALYFPSKYQTKKTKHLSAYRQ